MNFNIFAINCCQYKKNHILIFWKFCDTLLSEQRLQMENLWIEYLPRDTIVKRGAGSSPLSHKICIFFVFVFVFIFVFVFCVFICFVFFCVFCFLYSVFELNRIFAERYNCRKRGQVFSPFTQNFPIFQFTIYTQHCLSFPQNAISPNIVGKYCCEGAKPTPTPFPLKILTSNFGQTLNLYCLGHNNMEMDGTVSANCSAMEEYILAA